MEYQTIENHFLKLTECFLSFGHNPEENINRLVSVCGELMGASCALYSRLDKDMLCSIGRWNVPSDCTPVDKADGHICYDVIKHASEGTIFIRHLQNTPYANSDVNVRKYNLHTYIGRAVKFNGNYMGALCVVYQKDFVPTTEEEMLMELIASAIGIEEERRRAAELLHKEEEDVFKLMFENTADTIIWVDAETKNVINCNAAAETLLETDKRDIIGFPIMNIHPSEKRECYAKLFLSIVEQGKTVDSMLEVLTKSGKLKFVHLVASIAIVKGRKIAQGIMRDVTEKQLAEYLLERTEMERTMILNNMLELVTYQDGHNKIVWANKATAESFNTTPELLKEKICYQAFHNASAPCKNCPVVKAAETGKMEEREMTSPDGRMWVIRGIPVRDQRDNIKGILEVARDVTEKNKYEKNVEKLNKGLLKSNKKLQKLVIKDPHTGLYNHRYFKEIMESEFYRTKRYNQLLSLIFIDIDYFRSVNDAYGYKIGDLVLKQFAQRLKKSVRMHDYVVRFGDEEFVIVLPGSSKSGALELGQRISNSIKMFNFGDGKNTVRLRVSMAIVSYPEDGMSRSSEFIEIADKILNRAKEFGGDKICTISDINDNSIAHDKITTAKHLKQKLAKLTKKSNQSSIESIFAFAKTIELKDHYTGNHVERTVYYANEIAKRLKLPAEDIKLIEQASMLHDLGKIGISEKILLKKGPLTRREFNKIKNHPKIGVDIIRPIQSFHSLVPLILYHHERWDGKGYPFGLKGNEIPVGARIIAIADVYEALISDRPYRKALPKKEALRIIKENSGKQFDPKIADVLMDVLKKGRIKNL